MRMALLIAGVLAALCSPVLAQTAAEPAAPAPAPARWRMPTEPFKIIDNVYYVGTAGLASFLVTSPEGHVLIDTALPDGTSMIKANIEKLGFKLTDIKFLLNTHAHVDRAGGFAELKRDTGAQMLASARDKPLLEGGYSLGPAADATLKFPPVQVDRIVGQGDTVRIGKLALTAHMTPGLSPGCTSWTTVAREKKWNHTVVFFCGARLDANRLVASAYPGIVDDYRKTFVTARGIIADVFLAPHTDLFGMDKKRALLGKSPLNPFIRAGEFHAFSRSMEKAFDSALAAQTEANAGAPH